MLVNSFNCDKCGITCQNQTALTNHKLSEKTVNCGLCFKTFKNLCELYFSHSTNDLCALLPVSCNMCNKRFASVAYMQKHKETTCEQSKETPANIVAVEEESVDGQLQSTEDLSKEVDDLEEDVELVGAVTKDNNLNTLDSSLEKNLDAISKRIKQEIDEEGGVTIKEEVLDPSYEQQNEFEAWIKNAYPKLYNEYSETSTPTISSILPTMTICAICNLGYITGFHYGIYCCKNDLQFIKNTFTDNLIYAECGRMCPPQKTTWCNYCRLRKCLKSGMDISLVQKDDNEEESEEVLETENAVDEKNESTYSTEYEDVMDAEVWLKNVYPMIYVEYASNSSEIGKNPTKNDICSICSLSANHRDWFGIRCCRKDDEFLRITFSKRLSYKSCSKLCPPRMYDWCKYCRLRKCLSSGVKLWGMQLNRDDLIKTKISKTKFSRSNFIKNEEASENEAIMNERKREMLANIEMKEVQNNELQEDPNNKINSPTHEMEDEEEKGELEIWIKDAYPKIYEEYEREKRFSQTTIAISPPPSVYNFLRMIFSDKLVYEECENMCPMTLGKLFCGYCRVRRSLKAGINLSFLDTDTKSPAMVAKAAITVATAKDAINLPMNGKADPLQITLKYEEEPKHVTADAVSWVRRNYPLIYEDYLRREEIDSTVAPEICPICHLRPHSGLHYGMYCCEGDKQFMKRTFHEQIVYEICPTICIPKPRGWCQYCRLRECLKSGVDLNLIRVSEARRRKQIRQKKNDYYTQAVTKKMRYGGVEDLTRSGMGLPFQKMDSVQQIQNTGSVQQFQVPWQMQQTNPSFSQFYMQQNILIQNSIRSSGQEALFNPMQEPSRRGMYFKCDQCEHMATTGINLKRHVNAIHGSRMSVLVPNTVPKVEDGEKGSESYTSIMF